jgi:hypothetical protein
VDNAKETIPNTRNTHFPSHLYKTSEMLHLQCHNFHPLSPQIFPLSHHHTNHHLDPLKFLYKPPIFTPFILSALPRSRPDPPLWLAQLPEQAPEPEEEGPIEILRSSPSIFATSDDPSSIQVATSVLLTGAISVFLFRSLRRRAKRSKELVFSLTFLLLLMCSYGNWN